MTVPIDKHVRSSVPNPSDQRVQPHRSNRDREASVALDDETIIGRLAIIRHNHENQEHVPPPSFRRKDGRPESISLSEIEEYALRQQRSFMRTKRV